MNDLDYDVLVIGSGFGGSVAALRLTAKGYRAGVLEAGRRSGDPADPLPGSATAVCRRRHGGSSGTRARHVTSLPSVLRPGGRCYLICFSDRQPVNGPAAEA